MFWFFHSILSSLMLVVMVCVWSFFLVVSMYGSCLLAPAFMKLYKEKHIVDVNHFNITRRSFNAFVRAFCYVLFLLFSIWAFRFFFFRFYMDVRCFLSSLFRYFTLKLIHLCRIDNDKVNENKNTTWYIYRFDKCTKENKTEMPLFFSRNHYYHHHHRYNKLFGLSVVFLLFWHWLTRSLLWFVWFFVFCFYESDSSYHMMIMAIICVYFNASSSFGIRKSFGGKSLHLNDQNNVDQCNNNSNGNSNNNDYTFYSCK